MRKLIFIVLSSTLIITLLSCRKEKNAGIPTVLKGHVADTIRKINISGYKVVLIKSWGYCDYWMCGTKSEEVATAYSDSNGDYSITFNYKLNPGESYLWEEQYYGTPYYPEYYSGSGTIVSGRINTRDIFVWRPIELILNVDVINNNHTPLVIGNRLANSNSTLFNTEFIYEQNIKKTIRLRTRPNSYINIAFWYCADGPPCGNLRQKVIPFRTTLDSVITPNYTIDCSTF
jgi:hypothetical protein